MYLLDLPSQSAVTLCCTNNRLGFVHGTHYKYCYLILSLQLPLSLLRAAQGSPVLVELKSGETYNGRLSVTDAYMNLTLQQVICTSQSGERFWKLSSANIRGSAIKYLRLPDNCLDLAAEQDEQQEREQQQQYRGGGGGRGRGGRGAGRGGRYSGDGGGRGGRGRGGGRNGGGRGRGGGRVGGGRGRGPGRVDRAPAPR